MLPQEEGPVSMTNNKRRLASGISTVAIVVSMCLATPAQAQTTSTVRGHVDGAAAGSTVTLTDLNTNRSDTAKVDVCWPAENDSAWLTSGS